MSYKIVIDSCGDLTDEMKANPCYESIPLTLEVEGEQIIDDRGFDQKEFLKKVAASPNSPKSACPSPESYRRAFDCEADHVFAVTLSAELSGSYNSAVLGMNLILEENPDQKIHVFNSKSASVGETLIAKKIEECEASNMEFDEIIQAVEAYISSQNTYFVLENLDTLRKNGRLSKVKALVATALKIKPVMGSTDEGSICQLDQARGINKALMKMADYATQRVADSEHRTLAIAHCNCPQRAEVMKEGLLSRMKVKDVFIVNTAGVSSMYANDGGIIVVI